MFFSSNIKFLRKRQRHTQDDVATSLEMKRSTLSGYENGVALPSVSVLLAFSDYFGISIDTLIRVDLTPLRESQLFELERGNDVFVHGSRIRILATTVGSDNEENIELVPEKAKAGYAAGYADPEYISELPIFRLPFLDREKKYRTFQISGDSMLPIPDGSWVTGEFVVDWNSIKNGTPCIVLTVDDGIVFKIVENNLSENQQIRLISLNPLFEPYDLQVSNIREIWKFTHVINDKFPEKGIDMESLFVSMEQMRGELRELRKEVIGNGELTMEK
ncbi:MAG: LexA family transcriptional regulator [Salinivirgaceae bacterium]|nr:LexA family transcriptional regulator [Salinivirgaceae bacterium]